MTRFRTTRVRIWLFAALALACVACAGLLGLDDVSYVGPDGSTVADASTDGSQASDGTVVDGPSPCDPDGDDPRNCGQCGRVCVGCEAGMCTPEVVADLGDGEAAQLIAADDAGVYFTTATGVGSASRLRAVGTSPTNPKDFGPLPFHAGAIALLGSDVYVASDAITNDGGVLRCDKAGALGCSSYLGTSTPVRGLGTSDTSVYVSDGASLRSFGGDGGFFTSLLDAGPNDDLGVVGVSDDNFWCIGGTVTTTTHMLRCKNNVYRYGFRNQPRSVLVVENDVYWSDTEIHSMHRDGGDGVSFGNGQPVQFAANATHLYWIGSSVLSCARSTGCGTGFPASAATDSSGAIAVAGGFVYWTERKNPSGRPGRVLRVPAFK